MQQFVDYFQNEHRLTITMLSCGVVMLYSSFMSKGKMKDRLPMPMDKLYELVSKKPLPAHTKHLIFEVCCEDTEEEDVEVIRARICFSVTLCWLLTNSRN